MSLKRFAQRAIEGEKGLAASLYRAGASVVSPFYGLAVSVRNARYDKYPAMAHPLGRPTISIGNLTAGGTGKTPTAVWLCERLISAGHTPAILMRGYGGGDEAALYGQLGGAYGNTVEKGLSPDRVAKAAEILASRPDVSVFVLDDGFQHRRARRDFDLVLISTTQMDATQLLPRGLLREPLSSLDRAHAVLLTKCDRVSAQRLREIEATIHRYNPAVPIFHSSHRFLDTPANTADLRDAPFFACAGIGDPSSFESMLRQFGANFVGHRWFEDHHVYTKADVDELIARATSAGAKRIVTTSKDFPKLIAQVGRDEPMEIRPILLELQFAPGEDESLINLICDRLKLRK